MNRITLTIDNSGCRVESPDRETESFGLDRDDVRKATDRAIRLGMETGLPVVEIDDDQHEPMGLDVPPWRVVACCSTEWACDGRDVEIYQQEAVRDACGAAARVLYRERLVHDVDFCPETSFAKWSGGRYGYGSQVVCIDHDPPAWLRDIIAAAEDAYEAAILEWEKREQAERVAIQDQQNGEE